MKKNIKYYVKRVYVPLKLLAKFIRISLFVRPPKDFKRDIPIIINNYNQLDYLKLLLNSLEKRGYENIIILDNDSSYPPLLEFYKNTRYRVIPLGHNYGYLALWKSGVYKEFQNSYFVYTDPDLVIDKECPDDFLRYFYEIMTRHPLSPKVGFSLRIDDIPDHFELKDKVINWESQFWEKEVEPGIFDAPIDTTFALYRPYTKYRPRFLFLEHHLRVSYPYSMHHLPWYVDKNNLSENEKFYVELSKKKTHWTNQLKK